MPSVLFFCCSTIVLPCLPMFHHVLHHLSTMYAPFLTHLQVRLGWLDIGRPSRTGGPQPGCCWLFQMSHYHQVRVRDRKSSYNCLIIIHNICMLMYIIYIYIHVNDSTQRPQICIGSAGCRCLQVVLIS